MSKMYCISNKFSKVASAGALHPQRLLTFSIGDLKLRGIFKLIMAKSNWKKKSVMTSLKWRHHHYVTEKRHQNNVNFFSLCLPPPNQNFWLRQWRIVCIDPNQNQNWLNSSNNSTPDIQLSVLNHQLPKSRKKSRYNVVSSCHI